MSKGWSPKELKQNNIYQHRLILGPQIQYVKTKGVESSLGFNKFKNNGGVFDSKISYFYTYIDEIYNCYYISTGFITQNLTENDLWLFELSYLVLEGE